MVYPLLVGRMRPLTDMWNVLILVISVTCEYSQFSKCTCTVQEAWKTCKCVSELETIIFAIYETSEVWVKVWDSDLSDFFKFRKSFLLYFTAAYIRFSSIQPKIVFTSQEYNLGFHWVVSRSLMLWSSLH